MNTAWSRLISRWLAFEPALLARTYLVMFAGLALCFEVLPFTPHQGPEHIVLIAVILLLIPLARPGPSLTLVIGAGLGVACVFILFLAQSFGGINGIDLIWLIVMALPVLFLLGIRAGLVWLILVELLLASLYALSLSGHLHHEIVPQGNITAYVLMSYLLALLSIMLMLSLYASQLASRTRALDDGKQTLQDNYKALVKAQRHKEEFVAAIGHELRTPMSAILGLNPLLREAVGNQPEWVAAVDHIRRSTQQLLGVVNNVLDHSQLQANRLFLLPTRFDLRELLEEVQDEFRDRLEPNRITLHLEVSNEVPTHMELDRVRFRQILINLLDNAAKSSPLDSHLTIRVFQESFRLVIEVEDQGSGLPAPLMQRLNDGQILMPSSQGMATGAGLGLSISQALVRMHQGDLTARLSPTGSGTCMRFELPLSAQTGAALDATLGELKDLKNRTWSFLVVDDEPVNLVVVPMQIQRHLPHARVRTANQTMAALTLLEQEQFDVVVLDMFMPDLGGQDLARRIRDPNSQHRDALVLGLTASSNPDDWQACLQAGMDAVLVKPFDVKALLNSLWQRHHHRGG